jgi:transposase
MKFIVDYDLGVSGGFFDIEAKSEHDAYKKFIAMLESKGMSIDDLEGFSLTAFDLPPL